ncbi:alkylglycerol monooxygenase-like [Daphnia carinata]|uniref:alkylglycerol monooxygenase-like n=1 Tax=Daphnia carinata TaxID=120202 RepID=UPI00257E6E68|nr:alkylglycerol monooxygenase-like [Daphnia carinata]
MTVDIVSMDTITSGIEGLGHLFYVVNPFKTSFRTTDEVPHYVSRASSWFIVLIIIERILLRKKGKAPPINDCITSMACGLFMEINHIAFRGAETAAYVYIYENYRLYELPWDSLWTWLACAVGMDLGYYWAHRATHEVNLFWSQHQVHHSSEEYNLTTALRQGVWQGFTTMFYYLPMAFFIPPSQFFVHSQFNLLFQFWIHTEVIDNLGPLEWVLNTPSHHRVHHGSTRYCVDKNYAGVLIIWDRMFGTFEAERRDEPLVYGLIEQVDSFNPFYLEFFYLRKVFEKMQSMSTVTDKFKAIFYGPGWVPGSPKLGHYDQLPETIIREKFSHPLTPHDQIYAAIHFLLLSEGYRAMATHYEEFDGWLLYGCCAYVIVSLISIGLLFNRNSWFPWIEMIRCLVFLAYQLHFELFLTETIGMNLIMNGIRLFYLYSALQCKIECVRQFRDNMQKDKIK